MKISGIPIARKILRGLKKEIVKLKLRPHLVIISAGNNPNSQTYIRHKQMAAEKTGIIATVYPLNPNQESNYFKVVEKLNADPSVHGIITQLPVYAAWNSEKCITTIATAKDVDGFRTDSPFHGATALAVWEMLGAFAHKEKFVTTEKFLQRKAIAIAGKGKTAGWPTIKLLRSKGFDPTIIDSKTPSPDEILREADVIISATGRKHFVHAGNIKKGCFVIGIGVGREMVDGKTVTYGDIDGNIKYKAKLYCPTIGGIGPLTIACLLRNVVIAAKNQ